MRLVHSIAMSAAMFVACLSIPTEVVAQQSGQDLPHAQTCNAIDVRAEERPGSDGQPTEVSIGVRLLDVTNIDDVDQSINLDYIVRRSWMDARLAPFAGCRFATHQVWTPQAIQHYADLLFSRVLLARGAAACSDAELKPVGRSRGLEVQLIEGRVSWTKTTS